MEKDDNLNSVSVPLPHLRDIRRSTVGETYQYLHELVKGKTIDDLIEVVSTETPLPVFEENLRLMLIDCLHWENGVINVLLGQNDYQIKRILKCKWFFQNLSSEFCTKEIFPCVSQSLRCKIINKLSRHLSNAEEAEKYFEFVRNNYDNVRAYYLLPRCSSQFILDHFEGNKTTFKQNIQDRVLLNISRRYPEVAIHILSSIFEVKKKYDTGFHQYRRILSFLSGYHPDLMVPFFLKHKQTIPVETFGRRLTRKLVTKMKDQIFPSLVEKPVFKERYLFEMLPLEGKMKMIATIVRSEDQELSLSSWRNSDDRICGLLKLVPQDCRLALTESAFRELYNSNFNDTSSCWSSGLLELLPIASRQPYASKLEKFLKGTRSEFSNNVNSMSFNLERPETIIYLYDSNTAFQKFKELLQKSPSVGRRENIICYMVKNCSINNDMKALEEIVEFVAARHRNDDPNLIYLFMQAICDDFPATALTATIFETLEDLAYFFYLKGHRNDYVYYMWKERHIYYRLENGMDVDAMVKNLFESAILEQQFYYGCFLQDLGSCKTQPKHSKTLVLALCGKSVEAIREKSDGGALKDSLRYLLSGVLMTCSEFNRLHKKSRIYLKDIPGLGEILKQELKNNFGEVGGDSWPLEIWERYHNDLFNSCYKHRHLLYALKRNPSLAEQHMEGILNILFSDYFRVYNAFLSFFTVTVSFFGKTDQFKEVILKEFKTGESIQRRKVALTLYSRVCTVEEFGEAIEEYLPEEEKIQGRFEDGFDEIQLSVPLLIKNVTPRWKNLQTILKFFFGDFLKCVLTSFFSCCHHTRCDVAIPFLKQHLDDVPHRVSYQKEIIRLILQLSDKRGRSDFCLTGWNQYKHYSLRCILLREIGKLFLEQPSGESFDTLEKYILECDDVIINARPSLREMPEEYWNDYVSALWRFSEDKEQNFRNNFRQAILWDFDRRNVGLISRKLSESIIQSELFVPSSEIEVERFAALYLAADPQEVQGRVRMVLDLIKTRKAEAVSVDKFFAALMDISWEDPNHFCQVFTVILDNWPSFPLGVLHKQRILFTYHNLYQSVVKTNPNPDADAVPVMFGKELKKFLEGVENLQYLTPIYSEPLLQFFSKFKTGEAVRAIRELLTGPKDRSLAVLALMSLPEEALGWYRTKKDLFSEAGLRNKKLVAEIVGIFEGYGDDVVEIYFRTKFEFPKTEVGDGDAE